MKVMLGLLLVMVLAIGGSIYNKRQNARLEAKAVAEAAARSAREEAAQRNAEEQRVRQEQQQTSTRKSEAESKAKAAVTEQLIDPKSAEFRNIKVYVGVESGSVPNVDVVCGQINSKNRMGGYVGFTPFFWDGSDGKVVMPNGGALADILEQVVTRNCAAYESKAGK